jgi:hypothetical protein
MAKLALLHVFFQTAGLTRRNGKQREHDAFTLQNHFFARCQALVKGFDRVDADL